MREKGIALTPSGLRCYGCGAELYFELTAEFDPMVCFECDPEQFYEDVNPAFRKYLEGEAYHLPPPPSRSHCTEPCCRRVND